MFELLRNQSRSASGAILYFTIGTLMVIWSGLWYYFFLLPDPNPPTQQTFLCVGIILSGIAIAAIGLLFGLIGRGAKAADTTVGVVTAEPIAPSIPVNATPLGVVSNAPVDVRTSESLPINATSR
jgi:uncharacterized BrkB/YihY/UPF0761 family membrane protein